MKPRPDGFLSEMNISHDSEVFDYIRELHSYLWRFIRVAEKNPEAGGVLHERLDHTLALAEAEMARARELGERAAETVKERLAAAGATYDGHVTHGSFEAQMVIIDEIITAMEHLENGDA